jgi:hypothetical protein
VFQDRPFGAGSLILGAAIGVVTVLQIAEDAARRMTGGRHGT